MKILIKAKYVLSYDNGRHHLLEDGQVVYENADIINVGKDDEASRYDH